MLAVATLAVGLLPQVRVSWPVFELARPAVVPGPPAESLGSAIAGVAAAALIAATPTTVAALEPELGQYESGYPMMLVAKAPSKAAEIDETAALKAKLEAAAKVAAARAESANAPAAAAKAAAAELAPSAPSAKETQLAEAKAAKAAKAAAAKAELAEASAAKAAKAAAANAAVAQAKAEKQATALAAKAAKETQLAEAKAAKEAAAAARASEAAATKATKEAQALAAKAAKETLLAEAMAAKEAAAAKTTAAAQGGKASSAAVAVAAKPAAPAASAKAAARGALAQLPVSSRPEDVVLAVRSGAVPNLLTKSLPSSVGVTLPGVGPLRVDLNVVVSKATPEEVAASDIVVSLPRDLVKAGKLAAGGDAGVSLNVPGLVSGRIDLDVSSPRKGEADIAVTSSLVPKLPLQKTSGLGRFCFECGNGGEQSEWFVARNLGNGVQFYGNAKTGVSTFAAPKDY